MIFKNKLIFNKYKVKRFIQLSDYCSVCQGVNIKNDEPVFFKFEKMNSQIKALESEAYCLYNLKGFGLPKVLSYGKIGLYNVLIEEFLGNSLYNLWKLWKLKKKDKKSNLKNVCMAALQIINRLEYIHSKNYIHKDIKPHNFVNGRKDPHIIYIVDFGFSHKYRSSRTGKHIKFTKKKVVIGSFNFLSINANIGYEQSRRDDLESLGYTLIFLLNDNLPWMKFENSNINKRQKCLKIYNIKKSISAEKLCKGLPNEFTEYINYTRKLEFEEDPNYDYLRKLFWSILFKNHEKNDLNFFWRINRKNCKKEVVNSESLSITSKRREGSKNRLYNQIKRSLEKKGSQKKQNSLQLDHVFSLNIKYREQNMNYTNYKKNKEVENYMFIDDNEQTNNIIFNSISDNKIKYVNNFTDSSSCNNQNLTDKNKVIKSKITNNNKNTTDEMNIYRKKNKNILYDNSTYDNFIIPKNKNNNFYFSNINSSDLNIEENKLKYSNDYNKEYIFSDKNNQNDIIKKKNLGKNNFAKRKNNYKTLYQREKEKEKTPSKNYSDIKNDYFGPILDNFDSINQNNNVINLVDKHSVINTGQGKIIENNNIYNNLINNSFFIFKNINAPSLKQNIFQNFNRFNEFQNNKSTIFENIKSYQAIPIKMENHFNLEKSETESLMSLKTDNFLFRRRNRESFGAKLNKNKNYYKYEIKCNSPYKSGNDLISANNNFDYRNNYSLNNSNNDFQISLTQLNKQLNFPKFF